MQVKYVDKLVIFLAHPSPLTNNLIHSNNYRDVRDKISDRDDLLKHLWIDLLVNDVDKMKPETLGQIMGSFEIGDVMATKQELFERVHFSGDCEALLRELVALCLAYAICDRLERVA